MRANGSDIEYEVVCLLFLRALPDEYKVFRQMLEREREKLTIDRLRSELRARYDLLKEEKSSKSSDTAFLASGMKRGISGRRREKCGNVSGTKKKDGAAMRRGSNGQGSQSQRCEWEQWNSIREARSAHTLQHLQGDGAQVFQVPQADL